MWQEETKPKGSLTLENDATQDCSGMYHLMPQRHLPVWRKEDKRAFVHYDSSGINHAITSNRVCHNAFQSVVLDFIVPSRKCS